MYPLRYYLEMRNRICVLVAAWIVSIFVSYVFKEVLLNIVTCTNLSRIVSFIFTNVTEVFSLYFHLVLFFSNQILLFFFIYHLLVLALPSITKMEASFFVFILTTSLILIFLSFLFFNTVLFPLSWNFFLSFQSFDSLKTFSLDFEAKILDFGKFYTQFYFVCVVYFQAALLPILFFKYSQNDSQFYFRSRKVVGYFCVVFCTMITPPDVLSQIFLSFCFIFFCEFLVYLSILKSCLIFNRAAS